MTCKIELEEMRFYAYHGVLPQETRVGNWFTVYTALTLPVADETPADRLEKTIDYGSVYRLIGQEMQTPSKLLEHVAGRIFQALKNKYPRLAALTVKVSKQGPPLGGEVGCASVTLEENWNRQENASESGRL